VTAKRSNGVRRLLLLALAGGLACPASALADRSSARLVLSRGTTLELQGSHAGDELAVDARQSGVSLVTSFHDSAAPIVVAVPAGSGIACRGSGSHSVACASQVVTRLRVLGGRRADVITVTTGAGTGVRAVIAHGGPGDDAIDMSAVSMFTFLTGGAGDDAVTGSAADDVLSGGPGADVLRGGPGRDAVDYSQRRHPLAVTNDDVADDGAVSPAEGDNVGSDVEELRGGAADDRLTAGTGASTTLVGNGGADVLTGGPGADRLVGGLGADTMSGGAGTDVADYSARTTELGVSLDGQANDGSVGEGDGVAEDVENVLGGLGPDALTGSAGANELDGGPGDDVIDGGAGRDSLVGADGADVLRARDDTVDEVACGPGDDAASLDERDRSSECEIADTSGELNVDSRFAGVRLPFRTLRFGGRGAVAVPVICPPVEASCTGNVSLLIGPRRVSTRFFASGGELVRVRLVLPPGLRRRAAVRVSARAADAAGNQHTTRRRARLVARRGQSR
jgi:Ca2+-binding RTX toxin-like protein